MGREILYCAVCRTQLRSRDFENRQAFRAGMEAYCAACLPPGTSPDPVDPGHATPRRASPAVSPKPSSSSRISFVKENREKSTRKFAPPAKQAFPMGLVGGIAAAAVIGIIIILAAGSSSAPRTGVPTPDLPPPPQAGATTPAPPVTPNVDPPRTDPDPNLRREKEAARALKEAREFSKADPENLKGRISRYERAVRLAEGTQQYAEVRRELDAIQRKVEEEKATELISLDRQTRAAFENEEFGLVLALLENARKNRPYAEWGREIDKRRQDLSGRIQRAFEKVRKEAETARRGGNEDRVRALENRVGKWGLKELGDQLAKALAAVATPAPVVAPPKSSSEIESYRTSWRRAMTQASAGDYDGAREALEEAIREFREEKTRAEAAVDRSLLERAAALREKALEALVRSSKGKSIRLVYADANGNFTEITGTVAKVQDNIVRLEEGKIEIEVGEVRVASLLENLPGARRDRAAAAVLRFLEGVPMNLEDPTPKDVPEKYRLFAREGAARTANRAGKEGEARRLYFGAKGDLLFPRTGAEGVRKLQSLLADHGETAFVKRNRKTIEALGKNEGREYVFTVAALVGTGTFKEVNLKEFGPAWVSAEERASSYRKENYIQLEFAVVPGERYRCWMYVGGCCAQTLTFFAQGSELRTKRGGPVAEPGGALEVPVRQKVVTTRRRHSDHEGPKRPERWGWVEIPLPEYQKPGVKTVRLLSDQKGIGVGAALISTTRKRAPSKTETQKLLEAPKVEVRKALLNLALVGHWKFEDGKGTRALDATPNGFDADLKGGTRWSQGRIGGAVTFDGNDDAAEVPDHELLRITGDMTIAFWMKKDKEASDWSRLVGKGDTKLRNYGVWEENGASKKILWQQYDKNGKSILSFTSNADVEIGKWVHVAAVIRGKKGEIFINGRLDTSETRTGIPATSGDPLTFATCSWHSAFPGALDDIRVYNRALSAAEVAALFGEGD